MLIKIESYVNQWLWCGQWYDWCLHYTGGGQAHKTGLGRQARRWKRSHIPAPLLKLEASGMRSLAQTIIICIHTHSLEEAPMQLFIGCKITCIFSEWSVAPLKTVVGGVAMYDPSWLRCNCPFFFKTTEHWIDDADRCIRVCSKRLARKTHYRQYVRSHTPEKTNFEKLAT